MTERVVTARIVVTDSAAAQTSVVTLSGAVLDLGDRFTITARRTSFTVTLDSATGSSLRTVAAVAQRLATDITRTGLSGLTATARGNSLTLSDRATPRTAPAPTATASANTAPRVVHPLEGQWVVIGTRFSYRVPTDTFTDSRGDSLSLGAAQVSGRTAQPLPDWLSFNGLSRTFAGTPPIGTTSLALRVFASDGYGGSTSSDFVLDVRTTPPTTSTSTTTTT